MHVLGNSLGARIALELAARGRALAVVAIAPSGLNLWPERVVQGAGMAMARIVGRALSPLIGPLSRSALGRTALLLPLKARPWATSREEAIGAREGFADSRDYWRTLFWALLADVPRGMDRIDCPVLLVQGAAARGGRSRTAARPAGDDRRLGGGDGGPCSGGRRRGHCAGRGGRPPG